MNEEEELKSPLISCRSSSDAMPGSTLVCPPETVLTDSSSSDDSSKRKYRRCRSQDDRQNRGWSGAEMSYDLGPISGYCLQDLRTAPQLCHTNSNASLKDDSLPLLEESHQSNIVDESHERWNYYPEGGSLMETDDLMSQSLHEKKCADTATTTEISAIEQDLDSSFRAGFLDQPTPSKIDGTRPRRFTRASTEKLDSPPMLKKLKSRSRTTGGRAFKTNLAEKTTKLSHKNKPRSNDREKEQHNTFSGIVIGIDDKANSVADVTRSSLISKANQAAANPAKNCCYPSSMVNSFVKGHVSFQSEDNVRYYTLSQEEKDQKRVNMLPYFCASDRRLGEAAKFLSEMYHNSVSSISELGCQQKSGLTISETIERGILTFLCVNDQRRSEMAGSESLLPFSLDNSLEKGSIVPCPSLNEDPFVIPDLSRIDLQEDSMSSWAQTSQTVPWVSFGPAVGRAIQGLEANGKDYYNTSGLENRADRRTSAKTKQAQST